MTDKELDALYQAAEQVVIDYNTQAMPGWILRDYIAAALRAYGSEQRERAARACDRLFADDPEAALQLDGYNAALACGARIRALD